MSSPTVSFVTDCKFLQSVTIAGTAIWLTITWGGRTKSGGWMKTLHRTQCRSVFTFSIVSMADRLSQTHLTGLTGEVWISEYVAMQPNFLTGSLSVHVNKASHDMPARADVSCQGCTISCTGEEPRCWTCAYWWPETFWLAGLRWVRRRFNSFDSTFYLDMKYFFEIQKVKLTIVRFFACNM